MTTMNDNYKVECGKGWKGLYQPLIDLCSLYNIQILQVKEKFGGLRFYVAGKRLNEILPLIAAAEQASFHVCEECGEEGRDFDPTGIPIFKTTTGGSKTSGWIKSLCTPCRDKWDASRRTLGYQDEEMR